MNQFANLSEKIQWLESAKGRNHSLPQISAWLKDQCAPALDIPSVQAAGTNGKGSVLMWLQLLLSSQNKTSGVFVSPHLVSHFERIRVDDAMIDADDWEEIFDQMQPLFASNAMTMFEMDLLMAMKYFSQVRPDMLLMETGLGGEFDAVTAMDHDWGIITHIGLDHMGLLGQSRPEIAKAKAGIFKPGMKVICAETDPACQQVFIQEAAKKQTQLLFLEEDHPVCQKAKELADWAWKQTHALPLYQKRNLQSALALFLWMGYSISKEQLRQVLAEFSWSGRFEVVRKNPLFVVDGAHNEDGMKALTSALEPGQFSRAYFSCMADKQAREMIELLQKKIPEVVLVDFDCARKADLHQLAEELLLECVSLEQMMEALKKSQAETALACGSLYFVGEILKRQSELAD